MATEAVVRINSGLADTQHWVTEEAQIREENVNVKYGWVGV